MNDFHKKITATTLSDLPRDLDIHFEGFHKLMQFRVRDILIVASLYDFFILEEAGHLIELILEEYLSLNLTNVPQITRVSTGEDALNLINKKHFDLVIVLPRIGKMDPFLLAKEIKKEHNELPVVLLLFDLKELEELESAEDRNNIDRIFLWRGTVNLLLAIIKYVEDLKNAESDILTGGVQAVLLIEDSITFYSSYLPIIYRELMRQIQSLIADEVKLTRKMLRMRARPKILLTDNYEEALEIYHRYKDNVLGIISDIRFFKEGELNDKAGILFSLEIRKEEPELPILLQSSNLEYSKIAEDINASFIYKKSPTLLEELREFILNNFGFGDFIFRLRDGTIVGRASNLYELEKVIESIPDESVEYHGTRNHFSTWLKARTEFELAAKLRPIKISQFGNIKKAKKHLAETLREYRLKSQRGVITDFSRKRFDPSSEFVRIGSGSMGGKARGLAFIRNLLTRYEIGNYFKNIRILVPPTAVIGTDIFDEFLDRNNLRSFALHEKDDQKISEAFLKAKLPESIYADLSSFLRKVNYPMAVRSSSLLEDSHFQPFAGIYHTYMFPNNHSNLATRLDQLCDAIKLVYASTFSHAAKSYINATNNRIEEEKMAIILQQIIGRQHGTRFYPSISGIARSFNYYPIGNMKPDEGIVFVALGFGKIVVEGGKVLRFSPKHPRTLPQFSTVKDILKNSQQYFYTLDMSNPDKYPTPDFEENLLRCDLRVAEKDGELNLIGSTYSPDNDAIYDGISRPGIRVITFAHILKSNLFPLAEIIDVLLQAGSRGMNIPVEIEFAANLSPGSDGQRDFGFLQIRPLIRSGGQEKVDIQLTRQNHILCYSDQVLGNGRYDFIRDIVYVIPDKFDAGKTLEIAEEIARVNQYLNQQHRRYLLIGPGRWGTVDRWLGIPVKWENISHAQVIVETVLEGFDVDPSHGTHFFHNLTTLGIGYFTINPRVTEGLINWEWILKQPAKTRLNYVSHIELSEPLEIRIDGRSGKGLIRIPSNER